MNILWVTNIALPEASLLMNEKPTPFGGWFVSASAHLADEDSIELSIAFPKKGLRTVQILKGEKINYYAFPPVKEKDVSSNKKNSYLEKILDKAKPDIVHIFGTEFAHALAMVNICEKKNVNAVMSIQGLVSIYAQHYMACLPAKIQNRFTVRDFIRQDNLKQQQKKFIKRGEFEIEALQKVKHIIGRTTLDRACAYQINPDAQYHFCNETLRDEFYKHTWDIEKCEKHSIFISQGSYPIKGLHFILEAMPLILKRFPDTKLYVGGQDIVKFDILKEKLKISSYGKYIKELIGRYKLGKSVVFNGILDEKQMCERYLRSHVFVCPSSIENSPNSLGEAMILGVPCVASDVGGVADLLKHREEGFVYQTDAPYMLAYYVCEIFASDELALDFSKKAREHAMGTHNREQNTSTLIAICKDIISKNSRATKQK
jgi:glycosyltransferase involved in cell wall biosynthesis